MPKIYGIEHILYLIIASIILVLLSIFIHKKVKTEKQVALLVKILAVILLLSIISNRTSIVVLRSSLRSFLPGSFCGASSFALAIAVIIGKKNNHALHSIAYTGLLGSIITLAYPEFIDQAESFFYPMTISGLVHHTITLYLVVIMLKTNYLKPELKKFFLLPLGLCVYLTYGLFLISVLGYGDAMHINNPILTGTDLNWFVLGMIFLPTHFFFLLGYEFIVTKGKLVKKRLLRRNT